MASLFEFEYILEELNVHTHNFYKVISNSMAGSRALPLAILAKQNSNLVGDSSCKLAKIPVEK
jgi:hypothetical protein